MKNIVVTLSLVILAASAVMGQTNNNPQPTLVGNHPAVKTAVEHWLNDQSVVESTADTTRSPAKSSSHLMARGGSGGARSGRSGGGPVFGGGNLWAPPVALRLNRSQYDERDVLQASLVVLSDIPLSNNRMGLSVLWIHLDSGYTKGTYAGQHVLIAGETIPLQSYIFDGSEPSGLYALVVMVIDMTNGQLFAMPGTHFVFRNFIRNDNRGYLRVDSAEAQGQFVVLRGNFLSAATPSQFVLIGNQKFPIVMSDGMTAVVDLGSAYALPTGIYDITLVFHAAGNVAYDSNTAPCVLRLFLPSGKG